ncbi:restriction endonuclease subunit S [Roseburia amylophila]|uniref:Restriction endonuclease subunit S n=1 Tax=Roseburia amylophila TaxID=2981794 RepID=A0ABT2SF98_9FIRM|nr:restriction endonuclease subunit S [Roseburia amylophila]MCU6717722.1 restriction endonuclease subunit S [Roseburia amylophila]SCI25263.1 EcoKI restriction-modification system protein HsdS [uncultured Roseburia sp.]
MIIKENILNNGWHIIKFSDCIKQLNTGLNPRNNFSLGSGKLKYITAKNLTKFGTIDFSKCDFIDEDAKKIIHKRSDIRRGDILFSSRAPIGHCHLITEDPDFYDIGESIFSIRVNQDVALPEYLCLYLASDYFVKVASKHTTGSIIMEIRISDLMNTEIIIPPREIQKNIAKCLNKIDRKIELNKMVNDNLEQQIKTIFTFQFLQNANTEWKQQSLAELSEMYQPKTISGKDLIAAGNYFVYGANGIIGKYNQYNHSESEIAVACRGASCGSIQMTLPFSWITGNAMVVKPHSNFPYREYLYYYLLAKNPNYLCSGSAQPQLTRENLTLYSLKVPSTTELNAFENYAEKVRKIIIKNQQENIELSTLRDWLLPMLMNGQATISD